VLLQRSESRREAALQAPPRDLRKGRHAPQHSDNLQSHHSSRALLAIAAITRPRVILQANTEALKREWIALGKASYLIHAARLGTVMDDLHRLGGPQFIEYRM